MRAIEVEIDRERVSERERARRASSVSAAEAGRVRCCLMMLLLLTSGCVSDAVSGPNKGQYRRGHSSIYTLRTPPCRVLAATAKRYIITIFALWTRPPLWHCHRPRSPRPPSLQLSPPPLLPTTHLTTVQTVVPHHPQSHGHR